MNIQVGDLVHSVGVPSFGKGIVLGKKEKSNHIELFIYWLNFENTHWYNQKAMIIRRLGETK